MIPRSQFNLLMTHYGTQFGVKVSIFLELLLIDSVRSIKTINKSTLYIVEIM